MKKALAIVFVLLAFAHIAGLTPFYFYVLQEIKTEMSIELANQATLQKLVVSADEYKDASVFKTKEENEFSYRGRMYDFKTVVREGSNYVFYVLEDEKETTLMAVLKNMFDTADGSSKNTKSPFGNLLKNFEKDFVNCLQKDFVTQLPNQLFGWFSITDNTSEGHQIVIFSPPDFV